MNVEHPTSNEKCNNPRVQGSNVGGFEP